MYEDLVKELQESAEWADRLAILMGRTDGDTHAPIMRKAADAIEKLSKKRVGTWHRVKATQRSYSFVCNSCGFMYPYLTRCCPNCGVEYIDEEPLVVD